MEWGESPCKVDIADTAVIPSLDKDLEPIPHNDMAGSYRADLVVIIVHHHSHSIVPTGFGVIS